MLRFDADQSREFLQHVGCPKDIPEASIFPFLRCTPIEKIVEARSVVFERYRSSLRWAFQPVVDEELIARRPIETWLSNKYYHIPIMAGHTTNEGSLHVNRQISTADQFVDFFRCLFPHFSLEDVAEVMKNWLEAVRV